MALITHTRTDDGIHEMVFKKASRVSIEELADLLDTLYQGNSPHNFCLLDMRTSGMLPLRYLTYRMRLLHARYPGHHPIHIAIVLHDALMKDVSMVLLRTVLHRERAQYFADIEKARLWLQLEQHKVQALS